MNIYLDFPEFDWNSSLPPSLVYIHGQRKFWAVREAPLPLSKGHFLWGIKKSEIFKIFPNNTNSTHFVVLKNNHPLHQNFKNSRRNLGTGSSRKADKGRAVATDWLAPHWPRVGMSMNHPWMNGIQGGYTSVIGSKEQEATAFSFLRALLASK